MQPRLNFSYCLFGKLAKNPSFSKNILFTDEESFTKRGIVNFHNRHMWCDENPHVIHAIRFQHEFSINVHGGIVGDMLIGPFVLPNRLDGHFLI